MISADVKANENNKKYCVKRACTYFSLILVVIRAIFILSLKNREDRGMGGGRLLNGKNLLSVTKVNCRQSLKKENW